jgi:hypothetical protein
VGYFGALEQLPPGPSPGRTRVRPDLPGPA